MPSQDRVNPLGCEVRAVEHSLRAFANGDGTFRVCSMTRPGLWWTVRVAMWKSERGWRLKFGCACESGSARPAEAVSCAHAAAVGRSLERRGLASWESGLWAPTERLMGAA